MNYKLLLTSFFSVITLMNSFPGDSSIVAVIYNLNSIQSYQIATYYAVKRGIPQNNIIGIPVVTDEVITRDYYYTMIRDPIKAAIESRGLKNKINYLVTTKGMPLKISAHSDPCEVYSQSGGGAIESFLCILFDENSDYCSTPRIVNQYYDSGEPFQSFTIDFVTYCPDFIEGKVSYLVSRLDAYSVTDVYKMIDRSAASDTSGTGNYILDDHPGAPGFEPWAMKNAALNLGQLDLREYVYYDSTTFHISGDTLLDKSFIGYCSRGRHAFNDATVPPTLGWTEETGYLGGNKYKWLNGAIFTTYESFNGYSFFYRNNGCPYNNPTGQLLGHRDHQNLVSDFIRDGGTAGIGNVYEPFVSGVSHVDVLFKHYAAGHYFIDAAYMSLSFFAGMNVVTGDPLCRISNKLHPIRPPEIPEGILLHNFPNPFNIYTTVSYEIFTPSLINLAIFNAIGEEVMTLPEEEKPAGVHHFPLSFENLPSGVYLYRLSINGRILTGKMIHLR